MAILIVLSFLSWVLTILAPCVIPILPVILSGSFWDTKSRETPYIIIGSLTISLFIFSLILKLTANLIHINPFFWKIVSSSLIIFLWITFLFPKVWLWISSKWHIEQESQKALNNATHHKNGIVRNILIGFSLGPIFSSCSPTYLLILSIILPANIWQGVLYLSAYILWLSSILLLITLIGQKVLKSFRFAVNPNGAFKKILWTILILVWVGLLLWFDNTVEQVLFKTGMCEISSFEQQFLDNFKNQK